MAKIQNVEIPFLTFAESATPGTPSSGFAYIYTSTTGTPYFVNDAGTETAMLSDGNDGGGGGSGTPTHTAFDYLAASLEPLAIEQLYSGTAVTAIGTATKLVVNSWDTDLGSGRWEIRDPRHPLMPLRNVSVTGNSAASALVLIDPSDATYSNSWTTYHNRIQTIYETTPLYLTISTAANYATFLPGPYGAIITSVNVYDATWLAVRPYGTSIGWNLHDEIGDAAAQPVRFAHPTMIPVSKQVATRLLLGTQSSQGGADAECSITYFNCQSTWGAVTDPNTYDMRDDFMGTALDTASTWSRTESTTGNVEIQTTAGVANWLGMVGNGTWGANGLFSQTGVARSAGKIFQCDVFVNPTHAPASNAPNLIVGWHDGAGLSYTDFAHGIHFSTDGSARLQVWENGVSRGNVGSGWSAASLYRIRITLGASSATYEIQGGSQYQPIGSASWSDITPGTTSSATTPVYAAASIENSASLRNYVGDMKLY